MKWTTQFKYLSAIAALAAVPFAFSQEVATPATPEPAAAAAAGPGNEVQDRGWPRQFATAKYNIIVHQPQLDEWPDFGRITFRAAISVAPKEDAGKIAYGTVRVSGNTRISKADRLVLVTDRKVESVSFPDAGEDEILNMTEAVMAIHPSDKGITIALDRIIAQMNLDQVKVRTVDVNLEPPRILASSRPAIIVIFLGKPRFKPVPGSDLMFAINTNWDVFLDPAGSKYYLLNDKVWLTTADLDKGPWTAATALPAALDKLPADDNWSDVRAALPLVPGKDVPAVVVSREPAELIVTDGEPEFTPVPGTKLMQVANTDSDLFYDPAGKLYYLLTAGRWFKAKALAGPWQAASASLPEEFSRIPEDDADFADVLAAVPGTDAANEAVILASIPEKATISRTEATLNVTYDGEPRLKTIETTAVQYVINTPYSVFLVDGKYYCCHNAVWFESAQAKGPWVVCAAVPAVIYTIPPTSPKYHVTYVTVYESTPTTVVTGYTSGYSGETVAATGAVMFGLGVLVGAALDDDADADYYCYHYHSSYYSYGCGARYHGYHGGYVSAGRVYGPYGGAGRYAAYNPHTGTYSRGAAVYGPNGATGYRAAYNPSTGSAGYRGGGGNAYSSWGRGAVTSGSDWIRGGYHSGPAGSAGAIGSSSGAAIAHREDRFGNGTTVARNPDGDIYAGKDGNVYKRTDDGWQQQSRPSRPPTTSATTPPVARPTTPTGTPPVARPTTSSTTRTTFQQPPPSAGNLQYEASARSRGSSNASRTQQFQRSGGLSSGGMRSGGGGGRRR